MGVVAGLWCIGCLVSSRGGTNLRYSDQVYEGGVWGDSADARLARRLQAEEMRRAALTPEEEASRAAELEQKRRIRLDFIEAVLPSIVIDDSSLGDLCTVCLAQFQAGDIVAGSTTDKCQHKFHRACILDWLLRKSGCPTCREVLLKEDLPTELDSSEMHPSPVEEDTADAD